MQKIIDLISMREKSLNKKKANLRWSHNYRQAENDCALVYVDEHYMWQCRHQLMCVCLDFIADFHSLYNN